MQYPALEYPGLKAARGDHYFEYVSNCVSIGEAKSRSGVPVGAPMASLTDSHRDDFQTDRYLLEVRATARKRFRLCAPKGISCSAPLEPWLTVS
jgi:hypothetical protein